ncbi:MAG: VTT domain-containing protein [Actinomycetales bacterium]|nr:VTT domain-containing protein [Actinomycetales bacterium]
MIQTTFLPMLTHSGVLNPDGLLKSAGPYAFALVLAILFVECGLLVGLILPGDSLLFITGLFIATDLIRINLLLALVLMVLAAVLGNLVGYWFGGRVGPRLFRRPDSRIFKQEYVTKTEDFFEKYGTRSIILARFTPIVRTLITITAGIAKMDFRKFATFSALGGLIWVVSMTLLGYYLGTVQIIHDNLEIFALGIVVISVIPMILEIRKGKKATSKS